LFLRFKKQWDNLTNQDISDLQCFTSEDCEIFNVEHWFSRTNDDADDVMENHQNLRNDYHELLSLAMIYTNSPKLDLEKYTFQRSAALHKARWRAKLLYSLKMVLF